MFKSKYIILILSIVIAMTSCERDDICIDPTTPNLIVVFYDKTNQTERKDATNLSIEIDSLNTGIFIPIDRVALDSTAIPLKVDDDLTKIRLSKTITGSDDEFTYEFTLNYLRNEVFVSRSCGFKTTFFEVTEDITGNQWNANLTINNQDITDETTKHISIFH